MHREILNACWPCLLALCVGFLLLWATVRLSGARLNWRRLFHLHNCEDGGVQSLAFVLTLPVFLMITLFIIQMSQLTIGIMVVNYSAYAGARAASVWIPAQVDELGPNKLLPPITTSSPRRLERGEGLANHYKYKKIFNAVAMALAPICPSRELGYSLNGDSQPVADSAFRVFSAMAPSTTSNSRIPARLNNKLAYAYGNTVVQIAFLDKDTERGPTYNPRQEVLLDDGTTAILWDRHEVGWQDPVTVTITHDFNLLPGPGRLLATTLTRADGKPDIISSRVKSETRIVDRPGEPGQQNLAVFSTPITASATMTNEGIISVVPYVQTSD